MLSDLILFAFLGNFYGKCAIFYKQENHYFHLKIKRVLDLTIFLNVVFFFFFASFILF